MYNIASVKYAIQLNAYDATMLILKKNKSCNVEWNFGIPTIICSKPEIIELPLGWYYNPKVGFTNEGYTKELDLYDFVKVERVKKC